MAKSRLSEILQGGQPTFNNPVVSGDRPVIQGGEPNKWDVGLTRLTPDRNELRADNQGFLPMWGNAIVQSAAEIGLGTLEGIGYLADAETIFNYQKQAEEGFGNWFSDAMKDAKEAVGESFPVYAGQDAQGFAPHKAEWWATHAPSIASTLSLLIPTTGLVKGLGTLGKASKIIKEAQTVEQLVAKGIKLEKAAQIVQKQQVFRQGLKGVTGAITSRYMENTLEARDTYEAAHQKALKEGKTEDEAAIIAGKAASNTWQANWINVATDIMQYTAIFRGANALKAATAKKGEFTKELFKTMLSEAGEEGVQYGIQKESLNADNPSEVFSNIIKNFPDYFQDPEFLNSITLGAVGGGVFHAAGTGIQKLANKISSNYENTKQAEQAFQKGANSQVAKSRFIPLMNTLKEKGVDEARNLVSFAEQDEETDQFVVQKMKDYVDFYEANQKVLSGKPNAEVELERTMWQKFNKDQIEELQSEVSSLSEGLTEGQLSKMKLDILNKNIKAGEELVQPLRKRYEKEIKDFGGDKPLPRNNPNQNILNSKLTELVKLEVEENKYSKPVSAKKQNLTPSEQQPTLEELLQEQSVIAEGIPNVEPTPTVTAQPIDEATSNEINNRGANKEYGKTIKEEKKVAKEQPIQAEEIEGYFPMEETKGQVSVSDSGTGGNQTQGSTVTDIERNRQEELDFIEQKVKEGKTTKKDAEILIKSVNDRYDEKIKSLEEKQSIPETSQETPEPIEEEEPQYPDQKKIDEETEYVEQEVLESDSVDEEAKFYGYTRIKNGWNVLAHLSRNYEVKTEIGEDGVVYVNREDLNNLLNKPEEQRILDFSKYPVGTKLTLEVADDAEIEMYIPGTKKVNTWGALKSTVDYTSNVPIAVKDGFGNVIGYIHSTDWMQESNIYGDIQKNIADVKQLRQYVIEKGSVATSIQHRTKGKFFKVKGQKGKVSELQPRAKVAVWNGQKWLGVGKDVNIINKQPKTGFTYTILQASPDAYIAVPIDTGKLSADIQRTLKSAILIYTAPALTPTLQAEAQKLADAGFDVRSRAGFEKLFNLFLFNRNVGEAYRRSYDKKVYKSPLHAWAASMMGDELQPGTVTSDKSHFNTYENSVDFTIGDVGFSLSRNRNIKPGELLALDNALEKAYLNVNANMLGGEVSIPILNQDGTVEVKQIEYQDFVKENSLTNLAQQKVGDTYVSFIQPVVTLDTSFLETEAVEAIHPEGKKEESVTEQTIKPTSKFKSKKVILSEDEDYLPALTNKDSKEIAEASATILIPGLTPNQQTSTIVAIAEDLSRKIFVEGSMNYSTVKSVLNEWRIAFIQRREEEESSVNKEHFNHYINNWGTIEDLIISYVQSRSGVDVRNAESIGENEDYDDSESFEKANYSDEAIFSIDNKDSMSGKLKRFFSFVPVHGDANKAQTYLGLDKFVPFDEIIDVISMVLSGKEFNIPQAIEAIRNNIDRPWAEVVSVMLENASEELQNQFIANFRRHSVEMEFVLWSGDDKKGYDAYIMNSNTSSLAHLINEQWYENMKVSGLLVDEGDDYAVDKVAVKEVLSLIVKMKVRKSDEDLRGLLGYFGITLSDKTLEDLKKGGLRIGNRRFSFHELFNPEDGALFNEMVKFLRAASVGNTYLSVDGIIDRGGSISYGVAALAKLEAKNIRLLVPTSFRTADKTVYSYTVNKFLSNRMRDLKNDTSLREHLKSLPFHKNSVWYEQMEEQPDTFLFKYMDVGEVLKKFKGRSTGNNKVTKLPPSDHEFVKMALFQQRGQKYGTFFYPTTSDKSTVMSLRVPKQEITLNEDGGASNETIDKVYQQVVLSEAQRIWYFEGKDTGVEGFDTGKGQFFFMPELNSIEGLFTPSGILVDFRVNEEMRTKVKEAIKLHLNNLISSKMIDWRKLDVASKHDNKYYKGISYHNKARFAAADYTINYMLFNANVYMTFIGDPALYHKRTKDNKKTLSKLNQYNKTDRLLYDYVGDSKETFTNVGKRLAADVAPGYEGNIYGTYKVLLLKDRQVFSPYIASYAKSLDGIDLTEEEISNLLNEDWREENQEWVNSKVPNSIPYFEANGTDAQEFTTWKEHLDLLWAYGKVTEKEKIQIEEAIAKGRDLNEEQLSAVLQPMKPVQVAMVNADGFQRRVYIKSASIPLIPQLTSGLEIDKLRDLMERKGIDRAAFGSAVKVGNVSTPLNIWNNDGTITDDIQIEDSHVLELDRSAFRIQQEAPYKESKSAILAGSQEKKLLFTDHLETTGFIYNGKEHTGLELEAVYREHYKQWFDIELDAFLEEIEYRTDGTFNTNKLRSILLDEAKKRNYDINTQLALKELDENGQFRIPIWAMPSSSRMEGVITSLIDNKVRKQKINGGSAVLGSPEGFMIWENATSKVKSSIVFTDSWDGKLKPQRIEDGVVKPAQVIAPWKFRGKDGKFLNITDYVKDGKLDLSKFEDKSLLQMFSYRIPTQGLNSMNIVEVVGYSPKLSGDMFITSAESTVQIGEDYDFDKRYNYWYNTFVDGTGKILKVTDANIDSVVDFLLETDTDFQDALVETFGVSIPGYSQEEIDQDKKVKAAYRKAKILSLQNKIIDIHYSVMSNSKVQKSIVEPLGYGKLKELAPRFEQLREDISEQFSPLSDTYQRKKFFIASSGKAGVGVFSLDSTMNTLLQGKDVKLTDIVEGTDIFNVKFGTQVSHGELSKVETVKGGRNKSSVISAFQSAAVDNEKMQILGKLNINNFTFDSIRTLMLLGFEEDVIAAFIGQDIIIDYVEKMANSQSSLNESRITESDVINTLLEKYKTDVWNNNLADSSPEVLMKFIENGRSEPNYNAAQLAILEKFLYLSEYGKILQGYQSALNTDSKGVGKSLLDSNIKQSQLVNNVLLGRVVRNGKSLFGVSSTTPFEGSFDMGQHVVYEKGEKGMKTLYASATTINGFASTHSLSVTNRLFKDLIPYESLGLKTLVAELSQITGRRGNRFIADVFNAAKSWVLPSAISQEEDLTTERKRLFFDEYKRVDGKLNLLKPSLANIAKSAQRQFGTNIFLQRLSFEINTNGEPSLIKFNGAAGENYDETAIYAAFIGLFTDNQEIQGTDYTTRQLAEDLVKYAYLAGGVQGTVQFIKYIPIEYLVNRNFGDVIRDYNWENPEIFGEEGTTPYSVRPFVKQFIQHNPWQVPKFELKETVKPNSTNPDSVTIFYPSESMVIKSEEGVIFPTFARLEGKRNINLFQFDGEKYNKIDTLGKYGMLEYTSTAKDVPSLIKSNQTVNTKVVQAESKPVNTPILKVADERTRRLETSSAREVLNSIVQNTNNSQYSNYASRLLEVLDKFNIHISANPNLKTSGKTIYQGNASFVVINPNQQVHELEKTILHELTHAVTVGVINQYKSSKSTLSPSMLSKVERLDKFYTTFVERVGKDKIEQMLQALEAKGEFDTPEQRNVIYGGKNLKEFVALAMTSPDFQDFMKNNLWSEDTNKTLWQKFVEHIQSILQDLGIKWGEDINPIIHQDILSIIQEQVEEENTLEALLAPSGTLWDVHSAAILAKYPDITERDFNQLNEEEQKNFINCL